MNTDKVKNAYWVIITLIIMTIVFFMGRGSKKCPKIEIKTTTTTIIDTIKVPIESPLLESKPVSKVIPKPKIINTVTTYTQEIHDTIFLDYPTFEAKDTLRYKNQFVAILDSGNCSGILNRHYQFGGSEERIVVNNHITNTIVRPIPLLEVYGGFQLNKKDIGPLVQLSIKQKLNLGYSYMITSQTHNLQTTYKIK